MTTVGDMILQGNFGYATCTAYRSATDIDVVFEKTSGIRISCKVGDFERGKLKDYYAPTVFGIGCLGDLYAYNLPKNFSKNDQTKWYGLMRRISTQLTGNTRTSSWGTCTCCDDFKNFSKFVEWMHSQPNYNDLVEFCSVTNTRYCIDKDIIFKGNKNYSFETCCLVPNAINELFSYSSTRRGDYPLGVKLHTDGVAVYVMFGRDILGKSRYTKTFNFNKCNHEVYNNIDRKNYYIDLVNKFCNYYNVYLSDNQKVAVGMAFEDFCIEKKKYMVEVADLYRNYRLNEKVYNLISDDVYRSILNWSFSITD